MHSSHGKSCLVPTGTRHITPPTHATFINSLTPCASGENHNPRPRSRPPRRRAQTCAPSGRRAVPTSPCRRAALLRMSARVSRMRRSNPRPRFTGTPHHLALSRLFLFATWSQRRRCRAARYTAAARCDARCCGARGMYGVKVDLVAAVRAQRAARLELVPHQQLRREVRLPCLRGRPRARSCSARGGTGSILCAGPH